MEVKILTLTGKKFSVKVSEELLVSELMSKIQDKEGIPLDQQRLICKGRQLQDKMKLKDYDIKDQDKIHLVLRLRGNGDCLSNHVVKYGPKKILSNKELNRRIFAVVDDAYRNKEYLFKVYGLENKKWIEIKGETKYYELTKTVHFIQEKNYDYNKEYLVKLFCGDSYHSWKFKTENKIMITKKFKVKTFSYGPIKIISLHDKQITIKNFINICKTEFELEDKDYEITSEIEFKDEKIYCLIETDKELLDHDTDFDLIISPKQVLIVL